MRLSSPLILCLATALASCAGDPPVPKQPDSIEGKRIAEVKIRYVGDTTVDEARLRSYLGTKAGRPYSNSQVESDITALYKSGNINDVRVLAEPAGAGLRLIYEITPRGPMGPSGFSGNTAFKDESLAKETKLRVGEKITPRELDQAARRLEDFYRSYGYSQASVKVAWYDSSSFYFQVEEGPKTPR